MGDNGRTAILARRMAAQGAEPGPGAGRRQVTNVRWYPRGGLPADVAYVGRASRSEAGPYGNPYVIGTHGDRDQVCDLFEEELARRLEDAAYADRMMRDLDGKHLACWCAGRTGRVRCHAEALLREVGRRSARPELYCD